jgi:mitogen-activated protein kinase organizer 1
MSNIPIILNAHKSAIYNVKYSKDGEHLMSCSQDKTIKLWNPAKKMLIQSYDNIHSHDVIDIAIGQDNAKFASVGIDKQVFYTDSITGNIVRRFHGHNERINTIAFNQLETVLVSGSYDCSVRIWDLKATSKEAIQILSNAKDSITKVIVLNDKIISSSIDGSLRVYDIRKGELQCDNFDTPINSIDISPDEKYFIVSGLDSRIRLFDYTNGEIIKTFQGLHVSKNYSMNVRYTIETDGLITTSENNDIVYYDLLNDQKNEVYKGHNKISCGLDTHPHKKGIFATSDFDGKILLWDKYNVLYNNL